MKSLGDIIGKTIRRVWVEDSELVIDFEDGTTLRVETDESKLRFYLRGGGV